jgi:hypothetical protein
MSAISAVRAVANNEVAVIAWSSKEFIQHCVGAKNTRSYPTTAATAFCGLEPVKNLPKQIAKEASQKPKGIGKEFRHVPEYRNVRQQ